jgi:hypothetical protein
LTDLVPSSPAGIPSKNYHKRNKIAVVGELVVTDVWKAMSWLIRSTVYYTVKHLPDAIAAIGLPLIVPVVFWFDNDHRGRYQKWLDNYIADFKSRFAKETE